LRSWEYQLARLFKDRDNKPESEELKAKIISPLPNISISLGDEIILDEKDLIVANRIYQMDLHPGDEVIVLPAGSGQTYYLIDKVGR